MLAAEYQKFKLDPEPPAPSRESYDRFSDPSDELFTRLARMEPPLRLLEGLIIPKSMKGGREAWVFIFLILPLVGIAWLLEVGRHRPGRGRRAGRRARLLASHLAGQALQDQLERLYTPLTQSLADADALTAFCRVKVAAGFKEERKRIAARRDEDLKRAEDNYRKAFAAAEAQRDEKLRKINEDYADRMVEVQTTAAARDARGHRCPRPPHGRAARPGPRPGYPKLDEKYKALKERSGDAIRRRRGVRWPTSWREGMKPAAAELDAINREVDAYCPTWNEPGWADRAHCRGSSRP